VSVILVRVILAVSLFALGVGESMAQFKPQREARECAPESFTWFMQQGQTAIAPRSRGGFSGGMGVSYVNATDIVNRINGLAAATERLADFKASVEFFGAASFPISAEWLLKIEYAYLLGSYNLSTLYGPAEFSFSAHMPTLIAQYVLMEGGVYNVKVGIGAGYHFGSYSEKYSIVDSRLTGNGLGTMIDLEANTAFGEDFFGYIGGDIRWDFIGTLSDTSAYISNVPAPTLNFFSVGAKLGFTFYF
jgi:hypothetical protein